MATESVDIVINAEDKATAELRKTQQALDKTAKSVRDVGGKAKASTELVGSLANTLGGSWLGSAAGQFAQLTERMSAFTEVGKQSKLGMMALKGGMVAAAGVMTYQLTTAILKQINGWDLLNEKIKSAREVLREATDKMVSMQQRSFSHEMQKISLIEDPEEQDRKLQALADKAQRDVEKHTASVNAMRERLTEMRGDTMFGYQSESHQEKIAQLESELSIAKSILSASEQQREQLREKLVYEKEINQIQADIAARKEADAAKEKAAMDAKIAAEKEALKIQQEQEATKRKISEATMSAVEQLQMQIIKLRDGDEAANALKLTMQGVDEATANQIASIEAMIAAINEPTTSTPSVSAVGPNTATESRFASGRLVQTDYGKISAEQTKKTADNTAAQLKQLEQALQKLDTIAANTENQLQEAR